MPNKSVFLAGASGLIGSHLLSQLVSNSEDPGDRIVALVRKPLAQADSRVEQCALETPHFVKDSDFFVTLGTTIKKAGSEAEFRKVDFDLPLRLARAAVDAGIRQFLIVSSVDADPKSRNFYLRVKGELEQELNALPLQSVHVFRPSFLMGDRPESRLGEKIGIGFGRVLSPLLVGGLRRYKPIHAADVAAAMVRVAREAKPGRHVYHFDEMMR